MGNTEKQCSAGAKLMFETAEKETKTVSFGTLLDRAKKNMNFEVGLMCIL